MRKIFIVTALVFTFFSCKKDSNTLSSRFAGVWEFENFSGYPFNNNFEPPGNGKIIVLFDNGEFERRDHSTVLFKGRYFLKKKKDCNIDGLLTGFATDDPGFIQGDYMFVDIDEQGRLQFATSNCLQDGGLTIYRKVEELP